jgi:ribose transport system permease protein
MASSEVQVAEEGFDATRQGPQPGEAMTEQRGSNAWRMRSRLALIAHRYGILFAWAILIAFFGVTAESFLTTSNFSTIFGSQAVLVMLSLALLIPLTAGEYDLSVAGSMGMGLILTQYMNVEHGWPVGAAILLALGFGALVGAVNAFFIILIGVESIIVTLGMGTLLIGVGYGITVTTIVGSSEILDTLARDRLFGIPYAFYYGLALTALVWYVYARTPLGRYLYFVGSGRNVARLAGLRVDAIRAGSLIAAGFLSALAGVVLAGVLGSSSPNVAASYLLPAFAAVFLGATAITPGRFNPWGTFIGVYFLITGITGLELMGYIGWIEQVFYGGALVVAVALSRILGNRTAEGPV